MNYILLFVGSLFYLAHHSFGSLTVDDLDIARSAMLEVAKDITLKRSRTLTTKVTGSGARGKGWSTSRRRRTSATLSRRIRIKTKMIAKVTTTSRVTSKPRNYNKFNEVMDQVERAMAQAQYARRSFQLTDLKKDITDAVNRGNVRFARRALGLALYTASKSKSRSTSGPRGRSKRSGSDGAKKLLADIKANLGDDKFSDFLALQGEVTLMYAVDITGSMANEIQAAKVIVTEISKYDRSEPVDFILSSFGDPLTQGTVVYKADDQASQFIQEVGKLRAHGGLDCAEFAYNGMINALYEDPRWGSPLYVFTDAPPKDATEDNKETLRVLAEDLGVTINFFMGQTCTQAGYKYDHFKEEAELHNGQFLKLTDKELKNMAGFTGSALGGSTAVVSGTNTAARKRRSTVNQIAIPVDDTVSKLVITVTTSNSPNAIRLTRPGGATWNSGRTALTNVIVYYIDSPIRGMWKLLVPSSVGKYEYSAKVSSPENIDFEHYYTKVERGKHINVRNPLAGQLAYVNLTISGVRKVQKTSLTMDIIDISGKSLVPNRKLTSLGKSGLRFFFSFQPPNKPFKLLLKGKTTLNKIFQRISRHVDEAKPLVLKEYYNSKHYTIKQGGSTNVLLYLFNGSNKMQNYQVRLKDALGYKVTLPGRQLTKVAPKRKKTLRIKVAYAAGGNKGRVGQTLNVILSVKGTNSITTELIPLMIV